MTMKWENLTENLDIYLAISGMIFVLFMIPWLGTRGASPIFIITGIISFIACIFYIIIRKRLSLTGMAYHISSLDHLSTKRSNYLVLNILFFILFSYSMASITFRSELYIRPLGYFISITFMVALLAIEIFFLSKAKLYTYFILLKIILISLSLRLIPLSMFPGHVWYDPWLHEQFTLKILNLGYIPEGQLYSKLPIMHLTAALTMSVTDLTFKTSSIFFITILQAIIFPVFIFLFIKKFLHSSKIGLLAALLIGIADQITMRGFVFYPSSLAMIFVIIILYTLFIAKKEGSTKLTGIYLFFMVVLILTHALTAFYMAILLFCFWFGFKIYKRFYKDIPNISINLSTFILFTVSMVSWWMYVSGGVISELVRFIKWEFHADYLRTPQSGLITQYINQIPFTEYLISRIGYFLFYAFSFIGTFYFVTKKVKSAHGLVLSMGGLIALFMGFFSPFLGLYVFTPRWNYYSQVILVIPAAFGLILACGISKKTFKKVSILIILFIIISFSMITDVAANFDTPIFSEHRIVRHAFTESEIKSMDTLSDIFAEEMLGADPHANVYISIKNVNTSEITDNLIYNNFTDSRNKKVVIREYIIKNPFDCGGLYKLDYNPRITLDNVGYNRIYNSESITVHSYDNE